MNAYEICATVMLVALVGPGLVAWRGGLDGAVVAFEAVSATAVLVFVLLTQGFNRSGETEFAIILAMLALGGGLVFVRYLRSGAP